MTESLLGLPPRPLPMPRNIGIYTVQLDVVCSLELCQVSEMASVQATSCEDARVGVMRVLRYRGWQLGKHERTLCPLHAPPMLDCCRCGVATPPFYVEPVGSIPFRVEAVPELADKPPKAPLCETCRRWARNQVYMWHRRPREEA